nr:reverse transcriptase domain-containing protein [Tanacetum cinerariifolium]
TQEFVNETGELRAISGHMLRAAGVQILENNLDNLHSSREENGTLETVDPQDLLEANPSPSSSSTTLSNSSRKQACILVPPSFSTYTPTPPQIYESGKSSINMRVKHHEEQIEIDEVVVKQEVVADKEPSVDAAHVSAATTTVTIDDITLAKALEDLKTSKPNIRGIVIKDHKKPKPVKLKKKDQILFDEEVARKLQQEINEQERLVGERARKEKKANIALIETWEDFQAKLDADYQTELVEESSKKAQEKITQEETSKRAGDELEQEIFKKQKTDDGTCVVRFGNKGKLAPRFVGPFEITERISPLAYRLRLPQVLNGVHDTFYVSNLKTCLADPTLHVPLEEIQVDVKLNFVEESVEILEHEFKKLKWSRISIIKVQGKDVKHLEAKIKYNEECA